MVEINTNDTQMIIVIIKGLPGLLVIILVTQWLILRFYYIKELKQAQKKKGARRC